MKLLQLIHVRFFQLPFLEGTLASERQKWNVVRNTFGRPPPPLRPRAEAARGGGRRRDSLLPAPLATPTHCGMTLQGWGNRVVRQSWKGRGKRQFLRVKDLLCIL